MNKTNNIFEMFDSINKNLLKTFDEFNEMKNNALKQYIGEGIHNEVTFKYDTKLEPEDKKKIIIDKLNRWNMLAQVFGNDIVVKFEFGKDEIFYFTWDKDYNGFVTVDPNGDKYLYNTKDETLNKLVDDEKKDENEKKQDENENTRKPSGDCISEPVGKTIIPDDIQEMDVEDIEKDFGLKDDKNLASNLRNALRNSYAEFKEKNEKCEEIFCPFGAAENFKVDVIDQAAYETDFDDNGNPIQIKFDISWLLPYYYDNKEYYIAIDAIYHNESANLDKFCELIKEKYNFSLGSWNVKFDKDKVVNEIQFIFTF